MENMLELWEQCSSVRLPRNHHRGSDLSCDHWMIGSDPQANTGQKEDGHEPTGHPPLRVRS